MLLRWNPAFFGGVDHVRVPVNRIWKPDIVLYNYADTRLKEHRDAMAVVSHNGDVLWVPPAILRSTCSIDILYFPYDVQSCYLKFGSWTYDGFKLDISFYDDIEQVDTSEYVDSNEWMLVEHPATKNVKFYPCCKEPFPDLTFTIRVKRIAVFYSFILVLPCVLLSLLTLVSFWLPPESPAKVLLGMNIFVAFFLLLRILADSTPPASTSVPLIGAYFCLNMVLTTLSSFLSVTVINIYMREDKSNKVPDWLRKIAIDGLSRLLCMEQAKQVTGSRHRKSNSNQKQMATIRPPSLPLNKWEPPPYQLRDSPMTDAAATGSANVPLQPQHSNHVIASTTATPNHYVCTYYRRYRQPELDDVAQGGTNPNQRQLRRVILYQETAGAVPNEQLAPPLADNEVDRCRLDNDDDFDDDSCPDKEHEVDSCQLKTDEHDTSLELNRIWYLSNAPNVSTLSDVDNSVVTDSQFTRQRKRSKCDPGNHNNDKSQCNRLPPSQRQTARTELTSQGHREDQRIVVEDTRSPTSGSLDHDGRPRNSKLTSPPPVGKRKASTSHPVAASRADTGTTLCHECRLSAVASAVTSTSVPNCFGGGSSASSGVEVGLAVEAEVKEIRRMLRSFMAKLSMRDIKDKNALEWRTVALALDRLFFFIYLVIILLALGAVFPWQEAITSPRLAKIFTAASQSKKN